MLKKMKVYGVFTASIAFLLHYTLMLASSLSLCKVVNISKGYVSKIAPTEVKRVNEQKV
jgi:hypothetical protein